MAMKKIELEEHNAKYQSLVLEAHLAHQHGLVRKAVQLAVESWDYIDGMMQYERKYNQQECVSIEAIDLVLRYAPVLFDSAKLDKLDTLLANKRRIERDTLVNIGDKVAAARCVMRDAHRLWDYLERNADVRQDKLRQILGGNQDEWRGICEAWEKMGLADRVPEGKSYRLNLSTRLGQVVKGKCSRCGEVSEAPKAFFLEELTCPGCRKRTWFVILVSKQVA